MMKWFWMKMERVDTYRQDYVKFTGPMPWHYAVWAFFAIPAKPPIDRWRD